MQGMKGDSMRKQGLMKRVLGGVMAVAFGAALCFAAPVKAEAADPLPYSVPSYNYGEILSEGSKYYAGAYADAAQKNMAGIQNAANQQLLWGAAYARTNAVNQMTLAMLGSAYQLGGNRAILTAMASVDSGAKATMKFQSDQVDAWALEQLIQTDLMQRNLYSSQTFSQMSLLGAQIGQLYRQMDNLFGMAGKQGAAVTAVSPYLGAEMDAFYAGTYVTGANALLPRSLDTYPFYFGF